MKGNKFLAAMLAASMVTSAVPLTALNVFANAINDVPGTVDAVTVEDISTNSAGSSTKATDIDTALTDHIDDGYWANGAYSATGKDAATTAGAIDTLLSSLLGYAVDASTLSFENNTHFTFNVVNSNNQFEVYKVTVAGDSKYDKSILDDYFKEHDFTIAKDATFSSNVVAAQLTKQNNPANDPDDELDDAANTNSYTFTGTSSPVTVTDGKATGKITVKVGGEDPFTYTYTANVTQTDSTSDDAKKAAISAVNAQTYPMYSSAKGYDAGGNYNVNHNQAAVENQIISDLKDAGYPEDIAALSAVKVKDATKTTAGSLQATLDTYHSINVPLAYSSDQKSADTQKSVKKVLKGATAAVGSVVVTQHKAGDLAAAPSDALTLLGNTDYTVTISASKKLSEAVQAKTATTETKKEAVVAAVQKAIDDQLTADSVKDNGVSVSVEAVNTYASSKVVDGHKPATTSNGGEWKLLVTTSIDNDFYGYNDGTNKDANSKTEVRYLVTLDTNKLSSDKATAISLADKTSYLSKGYSTSANIPYAGTNYSYLEMKAALTPETSNTAVTYKVADSKGNVIMSKIPSGKILDVDDETTDIPFFAEESNTALTASDGALGIMVTKPGTYTVTATAGDLSATAKLTIKKNFDDVPATSYYANAAVWAYGKGITAGTSENTFGTNDPVTRAQYVTWLYKYAVSQDSSVAIADDDVKSVFSDVATTAFYAKAVQWAKENGITAGTTATTFSPDQAITRAQAIQMLWVAKGRPYAGLGKEDETTLKFTDVPDNAYYKTAVKWAVEDEVTAGTSATTFGPDDICRRSQAIQFIYVAQ